MSARASKIVYIDSEERISGTPSNFLAEISLDGVKADTCCVLSMTIPRSYYLIRNLYNRAAVVIDGTDHVFEIPPGNYNVNNFTSTLLEKINQFGAFTMTFSSITGKYSYGYTGPETVAFKFEDPSRLGHQMGFDEVSLNVFSSGVLVSENVVNFISTSTLFLHSDMVEDSTSILQEIYADNTIPFSNLVYNCKVPGLYSKKMKNAKSSVFSFSLCDEHDKEVDLNGHNICVTLLLYQREDLTKTFQKGFEALIQAQQD